MRRWVAPLLGQCDNGGGFTPFELTVTAEADNHITEGYLGQGEDWYPIINGIPCFLRGALRPDLREFAERQGLPLTFDGSSRDLKPENYFGLLLVQVVKLSRVWPCTTRAGLSVWLVSAQTRTKG